jgi:tetratricopeptide (TPR) repeat protein
MGEILAPTGSYGPNELPGLIRTLIGGLSVGRLEVCVGDHARNLWFDAGQIRAVVSEREEEKLGSWLVTRAVLQPAQMALTLLRQPAGERFGAFLVQEGLLDGERLAHELNALSVAIVAAILLEPGSYEYTENDSLPVDAASITMTSASLLVAAVRAVAEPSRLEALVAHDRYVWTAQDALLQYQKVQLTSQEGYLLSRVDGLSTVAGLLRLVPLPAQESMRALAALTVAGLIELRDAAAAKPQVPSKVEGPAAETPPDDTLQYSESQQKEYRDIIKLASEIRYQDYYRRLNVARVSTLDQIHSMFRQYAQAFHPDRANEPHLQSLRSELADIYGGMEEAYETLGNAEKRKRYDETLVDMSGKGEDAARRDEERRAAARRALVLANRQRARELMRRGDVGIAIQLLDQAAKLDPQPDVLLELARLEFRNPMWTQRALDHLKHAVALEPKCTDAWLELATFWGLRGKHDRQRNCLERVRQYEPRNPALLEALTKLGLDTGEKGREQPEAPKPWLVDGDDLARGRGRDAVCDAALGLARRSGVRVEVYFHGAAPPGGSVVERHDRVEVLYARDPDRAILTSIGKAATGAVVATSSESLAVKARSLGASVVTPDHFWQKAAGKHWAATSEPVRRQS